MKTMRRASERYHEQRRNREVWLTFCQYNRGDPLAHGFGALEMLDESHLPPGDTISPVQRKEAEIITYVLEGTLVQVDSTGRTGVINAGEFQRMTTGQRVRHGERNASQVDWAHIFRISLIPSEAGLDCSYDQQLFSVAERRGVLRVIASPDGRKGSLRICQNTLVFSTVLNVGQHVIHELPKGRMAWLHVIQGEVVLDDLVLTTGDGVGIEAERAVSLTAQEETEILLLDLTDKRQESVKNG